MERQDIQEEIKLLLEELRLRSSNLSFSPEEAAGFLASLNRLSDRVSVLKHLLENPVKEVPQPVSTPITEMRPEVSPAPEKESKMETAAEKVIIPPAPEPAPKASESVTKKQDGLVEDRLRKMKVADLFSVIGINEKYQFISLLFAGNAAAYADAVKQLNDAGSKEHADELLEQFQKEQHWDEENDTVIHFIELVSRRYA